MLRNAEPHERYDFGSTEIGFVIGDVRYSKWPNNANIVFVGPLCIENVCATTRKCTHYIGFISFFEQLHLMHKLCAL